MILALDQKIKCSYKEVYKTETMGLVSWCHKNSLKLEFEEMSSPPCSEISKT